MSETTALRVTNIKKKSNLFSPKMLSSAGCDERGEKITELEAAVSYVPAETFVPEFSETRMIDTITWLASKDNRDA